MELKYILNKPEHIKGIGNVFPIQIKDYDEFNELKKFLYCQKEHFSGDIPLLDCIIFGLQNSDLNLSPQESTVQLERLFAMVLHKEVIFFVNEKHGTYKFLIDKEHYIDNKNYDELRKVIMKQNLIFTPKIFKNKLVQQWAEKALEAKSKNSSNITMEDILTTVSVVKGKDYSELMEYSIYQIYADFYRIRKLKKYDTDVLFRSVSDRITIEDFAEEIQMFKSPYDDLFVNKNKLNKLNKAIGEQ